MATATILPVIKPCDPTEQVYQKSPLWLGVQLIRSEVGAGSAVKLAIGVSVALLISVELDVVRL